MGVRNDQQTKSSSSSSSAITAPSPPPNLSASRPPSQWDFWIHTIKVQAWTSAVDDFQPGRWPAGTPQGVYKNTDSSNPLIRTRALLVMRSDGIIVAQTSVFRRGPVSLTDLNRLFHEINMVVKRYPRVVRFVCRSEMAGHVREILTNLCLGKSAGFQLTEHDGLLPGMLRQATEEMGKMFIFNGCVCCDFAKIEKRPCLCKGMMSIPNMTNKFIHGLFKSAQEFWMAKPWLYLRLTHAIRLEVPGHKYKFAQVLGGTGNTNIAVMIYLEWPDVQTESFHLDRMVLNDQGRRHVMIKGEFKHPGAEGGRCFADINFMEDQISKGTPLALMDPNSPYPNDPDWQDVLPEFRRYILTPKNRRDPRVMDCDYMVTSCSVEELKYVQIALHVIGKLMREKMLVYVPNSGQGDYRKYYKLNTSWALPDEFGSDAGKVASVKFPAVDDRRVMSTMQSIVFADTEAPSKCKPTPTSPSTSTSTSSSNNKPYHTDDEPPPTTITDEATLEYIRNLFVEKARANEFYREGQYQKAYDAYSSIIDRFTTSIKGLTEAQQEDPQLLWDRMNLHSNRSQAAMKLNMYQKVIEDTSIVIRHFGNRSSNLYAIRCLQVRARAYSALQQYEKSLADWKVLHSLRLQGCRDTPA
ncbi:hypothetical protein HDU76_000198 [Blyttiomyces sp. JEL0837]|nr:hypothetical protein HDU76_000198 [Blyttiomyces sp. JEL0837]